MMISRTLAPRRTRPVLGRIERDAMVVVVDVVELIGLQRAVCFTMITKAKIGKSVDSKARN